MKQLKKSVLRIADKVSDSCEFSAIRQSLITLIPLLIVGYGSLMITSLPIPPYQKFLNGLCDGKVVETLTLMHKGVNDFFAVILAVTTSVSYSVKRRSKAGAYVGIGDTIILAIITLAAFATYSGISHKDFSVQSLGNMNVFTALLIALISANIFFAMKNSRIFRLKRQGVNTDSIYIESLEGIWPAVTIVLLFAVLHQLLHVVFHVDGVQELLENIVNYLLRSLNNGFGEGLLIVVLTHVFWFFGIHGHNVLDALIKQNFTDVTAGIFSKTFQDVFVIMGGTGSMLCLVISILIFARKRSVRNMAMMASPAVLFNISEIALFGIPVILNPVFLIPFMLVPVAHYLISYLAISLELVPRITTMVEWTTPVFLSGYQATGSWKGAVLQLVCIIVGALIYAPFIRMFEEQSESRLAANVRKLVEELQRQEETNMIAPLTEREDELGSVARILAEELKEAAEKKDFFLMYQPQISNDGKCVGAEALIRWKHPIVGFIYPPLIIQLAKEKKILHVLEQFIFDEAAGAIKTVKENISFDFEISVNITNESLEWEGIENCIESAVKKHEISCEELCLEITEQDALSSSVDIMEKVQRLKNKGHRFMIDDFGMGHTSLLYLQTNYFDVVKLDGALTRDVIENKRNSDIIASIVYLGESLHFTLVAEWVETEEQRDELKRLGCDAFQGYLYSKPIPLEELIVWLSQYEK